MKRNEVLAKLKVYLAAIPGYTADRVKIGPFSPEKLGKSPVLVILQRREPGERIDDGQTRRELQVEIGIMAKIDQLGDDPDIQFNALYDVVHQHLESYRDGEAGEQYLSIEEHPDGPEWGGWDSTRTRAGSCIWIVTYHRDMGPDPEPEPDP